MIEYGDITLEEVNDGVDYYIALKIETNPKNIKEVANTIKKPKYKFKGELVSRNGTLVYGEGFLFRTREDAENAVKIIMLGVHENKNPMKLLSEIRKN